jgi:DNA-binding MarR family transcriptional regulator
MADYINLPRKILEDDEISNIQKNLLVNLYAYMNPITNISKISIQTLAKDLNLKHQNISKHLQGLKQYVEVIKNPANKKENWYKLMPNNKNFIELDFKLYRQWRTKPKLIIEYFKYKNSYFLIRLFKETRKDFKPNRFEHSKWGGYEYDKFCQIEKDLYDNGFIDWASYYVDFIKEDMIEAQIKNFIENYKDLKEIN